LLKLSDQFKILSKRKYGSSFVFVAPPDLEQKLVDVEQIYQHGGDTELG